MHGTDHRLEVRSKKFVPRDPAALKLNWNGRLMGHRRACVPQRADAVLRLLRAPLPDTTRTVVMTRTT
jgi:hypothetical protein